MVDNEIEFLLDLQEKALAEYSNHGGRVIEVVESDIIKSEEGVDIWDFDIADVGLSWKLYAIAINDDIGIVVDIPYF